MGCGLGGGEVLNGRALFHEGLVPQHIANIDALNLTLGHGTESPTGATGGKIASCHSYTWLCVQSMGLLRELRWPNPYLGRV